MTRLTSLTLAAGTIAAAALPQAARAQFPAAPSNPLSFGVSGGLAVPAGTLSNGNDAGYSVAGSLDLRPVPGPLALRLEVGYDRFAVKQSVLDQAGSDFGVNVTGNTHMLRGTANLLYRVPTAAGFRPYLTGGVGVYNVGGGTTVTYGSATYSDNDNSQTKFGLNGGVGVEFPLSGITVFGEARAHGVRMTGQSLTYFPITVGFRF